MSLSESKYDEAIKYVQNSYINDSKEKSVMLLGDVAELIKILTGKKVDPNILEKYSTNNKINTK